MSQGIPTFHWHKQYRLSAVTAHKYLHSQDFFNDIFVKEGRFLLSVFNIAERHKEQEAMNTACVFALLCFSTPRDGPPPAHSVVSFVDFAISPEFNFIPIRRARVLNCDVWFHLSLTSTWYSYRAEYPQDPSIVRRSIGIHWHNMVQTYNGKGGRTEPCSTPRGCNFHLVLHWHCTDRMRTGSRVAFL